MLWSKKYYFKFCIHHKTQDTDKHDQEDIHIYFNTKMYLWFIYNDRELFHGSVQTNSMNNVQISCNISSIITMIYLFHLKM